ncbi:Hsp20/alpha crystallin family protein [Herbaspirillum sp. RV1423]|uniref:Hsp20/alpha crystallin family protein n=1 Tax=Herbaspirillum sp. RV1423 TaxID=1443993 RepID=UPI0004B20567|nr:Hsp20/alpha crystallin family protein [Herbaspirillum sp. RV1423]
MTSIAIHEPISDRLRNALKHAFRTPWRHDDVEAGARSFQLDLDLYEDDDNYIVVADLPGVDKSDIKIDVEGNQVSITSTIKYRQKKNASLLYSERTEGDVYRCFFLDFDIDREHVKAKYTDGLLELTLPKLPHTQRTKRLAIQ